MRDTRGMRIDENWGDPFRPELAAAVLEWDQRVFSTPEGNAIAVLFARKHSDIIEDLDIEDLVDRWNRESDELVFSWRAPDFSDGFFSRMLPKPLRHKVGTVSIVGADFNRVRRQTRATQQVLSLLGLRPLGLGPHDAPANPVEVRLRTSDTRRDARKHKGSIGIESHGIGYAMELSTERAREDGVETSRHYEIDEGACKSMIAMDMIARHFGLSPDQPWAAARIALRLNAELVEDRGGADPARLADIYKGMRAESDKARDGVLRYVNGIRPMLAVKFAAGTVSSDPVTRDPEADEQAVYRRCLSALDGIEEMLRDGGYTGEVLDAIDDLQAHAEAAFRPELGLLRRECDAMRHAVLLHATVDAPCRVIRRAFPEKIVHPKPEGILAPGRDPETGMQRIRNHRVDNDVLTRLRARLGMRTDSEDEDDAPDALDRAFGMT